MKTKKLKPVVITIKGKDHLFKARVPLWKAYYILAMIEKENCEKLSKLAHPNKSNE